MFYGREVFDPILIVSQMGVLQALFYLVTSSWLLVFSVVFGSQLNLKHLLSPAALTTSYNWALPTLLAYMMASVPWSVFEMKGVDIEHLKFE